MADVEGGYEVIYDAQSTTTSTGGPWQPGQIVLHRSGPGRAQRALAKWVLMDNAGCSQGDGLVSDLAAAVGHAVAKASTSDAFGPFVCRGIAAATIASNTFGFMFFHGYVEKADLSKTAASGEFLCLSGSTAGKLTPLKTAFWGATVGLSSTAGSAPFQFAMARGAAGTGIGSVQILGTWG